MAELHNAYIQHLRRQPRGRLTCPECRESVSGNEAFFIHIEKNHPGLNLSSFDKNSRHKLLNDAIQATNDPAQAQGSRDPASPVPSGSKTSGEFDVRIKDSSVHAERGSRSPSQTQSDEERPGSKRRHQGDSQSSPQPAKQLSRQRLDTLQDRSQPIGSLPGIRPEDVDPAFVRRSPGGTPSGASLTKPRLFDPGPNPQSSPSSHGRGVSTHDIGKVPQASNATSGYLDSSLGQASTSNDPSTASSSSPAASNRTPGVLRLRYNPQWPTLILQPESREISQEQLAAEVKSIYTGLTMVETKCVHIDKVQQATPRSESKITDEHWQAMIALHRTLLHEHHDFFLASQHPSASPALKRLALKYSMPARMWKHGIHSFLELLRHRLPESLEYMLAFIYLAYQMMALLYETVGSFRNTWIECLGDLGRYRMAVEDEDIRDREIWAGVARSWYNKAADTNPAIGRLFHHLAILARPNMVQQLYLYNRSLTSIMPFMNARESIVTIFDPILSQNPPLQVSQSDASLIRVHALLFKKKNMGAVKESIDKYINGLASAINQAGDKWRETAAHVAIANIGALFDFGNESSPLRFLFDYRRKTKQQRDPKSMPPGLPDDQSVPDIHSLPTLDSASEISFGHSLDLLNSTLKVILSRRGDYRNVLPLVHVVCAFLVHVAEISLTHCNISYVEALLDSVPWNELASFINTFLKESENIDPNFQISILFEEDASPLPEDWMIRGLSWSFEYFPRTWFKDAAITEEEERYMERTSTTKARIDRVLSLVVQLAKDGNRIRFNPETSRFHVVGGDIPMADDGEDEGYKSEDSPEMYELKQEEQQDPQVPDRARKMRTKYGAIIPNVDILRQVELVNDILDDSNMAMVIPHECMEELMDSANGGDVYSNESAAALSNIRSKLNEYRNITIQDVNDQDLTYQYLGSPATFFSERPREQHSVPPSQQPSRRPTNLSDTLSKVARQSSDPTKKISRAATGFLSRTATGMSEVVGPSIPDPMDVEDFDIPGGLEPPSDRPALVITDDRKVRAQVGKLGTAAIAGYMVKKWLNQAKKNQAAHTRPTKMDHRMETPVA